MIWKLKAGLWVVVIAYVLYAIARNGWSTEMAAILGAAIVVGVMQLWLRSDWRKRLRDKYKDK